MKLKEKLADEYAEAQGELNWPTWCFEVGFLAGFEKAREMASELFSHSTSPNGRSIYKLVSNLGEEEVK